MVLCLRGMMLRFRQIDSPRSHGDTEKTKKINLELSLELKLVVYAVDFRSCSLRVSMTLW
jgi:hypothetical protein